MITLIFGTLQAIGALVGALGAVWAEVAYVRAARDGIINHAERAHLKVVARALRFGMLILLLSSVVLEFYAYFKHVVQPALTSSYWLEMILVLVILYASWGLSKQRLVFALGSGLAFGSWWFLAFLTFGQAPDRSFGELFAFYLVFVAVFCAILWYARLNLTPRKKPLLP